MNNTDEPDSDEYEGASSNDEGEVMAGDRRIARTDTALPDWYVSDTHYRPIPIVWFAGALLMQVIAQPVVAAIGWWLLDLPRLIVVGLAMLVSGLIWHHTWERGMHGASRMWQVATALMLLFFFAIITVALLG